MKMCTLWNVAEWKAAYKQHIQKWGKNSQVTLKTLRRYCWLFSDFNSIFLEYLLTWKLIFFFLYIRLSCRSLGAIDFFSYIFNYIDHDLLIKFPASDITIYFSNWRRRDITQNKSARRFSSVSVIIITWYLGTIDIM